MRLTLAQKFTTLIIILCVLFVGIEAYTNFSSQKELYRKSYIDKARSIANGLDANIKSREDLKLDNLFPFIQKNIWLYSDILEIKVTKEDGGKLLVIASNIPNSIEKNPDVENWKSYSEDIILDKIIANNKMNILRVYSPIHISGKTIGTYQIDLNMESVNTQINKKFTATVLTYGVFLIVIIALFIIIFNFIFIKPIHALISGLRAISTGNLDCVISIKSGDEYEEAAKVFNTMAMDIKNYHSQILTKKEDLEKQVTQRTKELEESKKVIEIKLKEIERVNNMMIGRELKMVELKKEIEALKKSNPGFE